MWEINNQAQIISLYELGRIIKNFVENICEGVGRNCDFRRGIKQTLNFLF